VFLRVAMTWGPAWVRTCDRSSSKVTSRTQYLFIVPPATALLGVPILGQPVNAGALGGIVLAAVGVAMVTWRLAAPDRTSQSTRPAKEPHQPDHVPAAEHT